MNATMNAPPQTTLAATNPSARMMPTMLRPYPRSVKPESITPNAPTSKARFETINSSRLTMTASDPPEPNSQPRKLRARKLPARPTISATSTSNSTGLAVSNSKALEPPSKRPRPVRDHGGSTKHSNPITAQTKPDMCRLVREGVAVLVNAVMR